MESLVLRFRLLLRPSTFVLIGFVLMMFAPTALEASAITQAGTDFCFICGCSLFSHFFVAPFGCQYTPPPFVVFDCYNHFFTWCMYIKVG